MQTKQELINALRYIRRGNVLLVNKASEAQNFKDSTGKPVDLSNIFVLVAKNIGTSEHPFITVPYYDVKRDNLWQDLFVWAAEEILGLDLTTEEGLKAFYDFTSSNSVRALGFDLRFNKYNTPMPEQVHPKSASVDLGYLQSMGTVYPAIDQHRQEYNKITIVPRFNTVKAVIGYHAKYGVWLMPSEVEKLGVNWARVTPGIEQERFVNRRAALDAVDYSFDAPYAGKIIAGKPTKFIMTDGDDVLTSKELAGEVRALGSKAKEDKANKPSDTKEAKAASKPKEAKAHNKPKRRGGSVDASEFVEGPTDI